MGRHTRGDLGPDGKKPHCLASDQLQGHLRNSGHLALLMWDSTLAGAEALGLGTGLGWRVLGRHGCGSASVASES